ncbi:Uncharacterised protein [Klebsiella michiganensis]|nr:Uncharacterised protein [Klebsiella michiganensis]
MFLDLSLHFRIAFTVLRRGNAVMFTENAREIDRVSVTYRQGDFVKPVGEVLWISHLARLMRCASRQA